MNRYKYSIYELYITINFIILIDNINGVKPSESKQIEDLNETSGKIETATVVYIDSLSEVFDIDIQR